MGGNCEWENDFVGVVKVKYLEMGRLAWVILIAGALLCGRGRQKKGSENRTRRRRDWERERDFACHGRLGEWWKWLQNKEGGCL